MKVYTGIYIVFSLVAALALAGVATGVGFIPALVPSELAIKSVLTLTAALVCVVIIVGALFCALTERRNARWLPAGAAAISLIITAVGIAAGWYIFWINPIARAEYEAKILGGSSFARELVSGQLDDGYVENQSNSSYLEYRMGRWRGTFYSSCGYRRGAPVYICLYYYHGSDWWVNTSGYGPPGVDYYIYGDRLDVKAERERLSRVLDLIAGVYPAGYDYNWDPAEFGDYNVQSLYDE
jgi:hypothetical protein